MEFGARKPAPPAKGVTPAALGGPQDIIKDATTATFGKDVLEASRQVPVIVDFWADWCGPCKTLTPLIEKVVKSYGGKVRLVKVNVDQNPAIAGQLRIQNLPTVYAFRDGQPLDGFMGAQPESAIKAFIDKLLGPDEAVDLAAAIQAGEEALAAGDLQAAAEVFAVVLEEEASNAQALAGLATVYLKSGDDARAEQTLALVPPDKQNSTAVAAIRASLDLKRKAPSAAGLAELTQKLAQNPADHQARIDMALAHAAAGNKEGALDELLTAIRRDRKWNEEAARKQLVQLFEAWGPKDPATLDGRKRLSSILFS